MQRLGGLGKQAALQQAHVRQCVAQQVEVVWREAEQEDAQHPVDDGQCAPVTVAVLVVVGVVMLILTGATVAVVIVMVLVEAGRLATTSPRLPTEHAHHAAVTEEQKESRQLEGSLHQCQRCQDESSVLARGRIQEAWLQVLGGRGAQQRQRQAECQHQTPDARAD